MLVTKKTYDSKISNIKDKMLNITGLATITALTAVENKITCINNAFSKMKNNNLYINLTHYNKLTRYKLDAKIKK